MTSKMRALLTMLGIIIGVAAVIVITSLGNGMTQMMNDQFDQLGANLIQVQVWGRGEGSRTIEPDDMYALAEKYPKYIAGVSPYVTTQNAAIRQGSDEYKRTTVYGVSEAFYDPSRNQTITGESLAQGRFLSYIDVERFQNVCIIGDYLNQEMFQGEGLGLDWGPGPEGGQYRGQRGRRYFSPLWQRPAGQRFPERKSVFVYQHQQGQLRRRQGGY